MSSIAKKLSISQLIIGVLAIALFSATLYVYIQHVLVREMDHSMLQQAKLLSQMVEWDDGKYELELDDYQLEEFNKEDSTSSYAIFLPSGSLFKASRHAKKAGITTAMGHKDSTPSHGHLGRSECPKLRYTHYPFNARKRKSRKYSEPESELVIVLTRSQSHITDTLQTLLTGCSIAGSIFILFNSLIQYWNIKKNLKPLHVIGVQVEQLDASSLSYRFPTSDVPSELVSISLKLNDLLDRLEFSFERERSFSINAAHELRTPLAELKAVTQVGAGWKAGDPLEPTPEAYFHDSEQIILRMQSLLSALLALVNNIDRNLELSWTNVDLVSALKQSVIHHQQNYPAARVKFNMPESTMVQADKGLLHGIISNLISNAMHYADPETDIHCKVHSDNNSVSFNITNTCSNLNDEDIDKMRSTFWRKDSSRTSNIHHGLGLSLVEAYANGMNLQFQISRPNNKLVECKVQQLKASTDSEIKPLT